MVTKTEESPEDVITAEAVQYYSDTLPYHNFDHAQSVVKAGMKIVDRCEAEHVLVNRNVVRYALLFHDAGYHEDHQKQGYATKEAYAAAIARTVLLAHDYPDEYIRQVESAIISTHRDAVFATNEAKAVRAADLADLAHDYPTFVRNSRALKREYGLLHHTPISWEEWKRMTQEVIEFYLGQDIRLTGAHDTETGESRFHAKARAIIRQFLDAAPSELEKD